MSKKKNIEEIIDKKNEVTKEIDKKETKNPKKRIAVSRDTEVVFMNNTSGNFFYRCPRSHATFDLYEYGDTDYITIEQLLTMNNKSRKILQEFWIVLLDTTNEDVEIEDVLKYLGLDRLYNDIIRPEDIDGFIINSNDIKFEDALKKMNKALATKVVERSVVLYKKGKLNSISKVNTLKEFVGDDDLFE
jgi:hypothetical protein